jgi:hypothetical protein
MWAAGRGPRPGDRTSAIPYFVCGEAGGIAGTLFELLNFCPSPLPEAPTLVFEHIFLFCRAVPSLPYSSNVLNIWASAAMSAQIPLIVTLPIFNSYVLQLLTGLLGRQQSQRACEEDS